MSRRSYTHEGTQPNRNGATRRGVNATRDGGDVAMNVPVKEVEGPRRCRHDAESGDQSCSVADGIDAYRDVAFRKPRPFTMSGLTLLSDDSRLHIHG